MDCFKGCPETKPIVELMDCPKMVIKVKISTGKAYSYSVVGSDYIPKKRWLQISLQV
jgi:hypothetical protein